MINELLQAMTGKNASDLVLLADVPVVFKVAGRLEFYDRQYTSTQIDDRLFSILSDSQKHLLQSEKQLDFSYSLAEQRFRINLHYQRGSLAAAIRAIPSKIPSRQELHLPGIVEELVNLQSGLVIVTGPTGAGKTTTQACIVELINQKKAKHIITLEDPVEYVFTNQKSIIEQCELGKDIINFPQGLRSALRQNPDVILIGEMRDLETISTAITAAETGHLVISTLHTSRAVNAVDRIIDAFPGHQQNQVRSQLSLTLQAVIAQQLIPGKDLKKMAVAVEILKAIPPVRNLIRQAKTHEIPVIMEINKKYGLQTMEDALGQLLQAGAIDAEQALGRVENVAAFSKRAGLG